MKKLKSSSLFLPGQHNNIDEPISVKFKGSKTGKKSQTINANDQNNIFYGKSHTLNNNELNNKKSNKKSSKLNKTQH